MASAEPPVDWRQLNQEFYSGDPAGYFRYRLNLLILAAGRPEEVERLLSEGVRYDGLITGELGRSSEELGDLNVAFLVTESEALLHHVSEALLRLFLAHASLTACPWLEVARLRDFKKFKAEVSKLTSHTWAKDLTEAVPEVFFGGAPTDSLGDEEEAVVSVTMLLRHLADRLLKDANLYNSVKHGMAIVASENAYVRLATDAGKPIIGTTGPSVAFLESEDADGERTWKVTRRWVSIRRSLWLSQLALVEIDALWAVARARYLDADLSGVHAVTREAVDDGVTGAFADRTGIHTFSRTVAVEQLTRPPRRTPKRT